MKKVIVFQSFEEFKSVLHDIEFINSLSPDGLGMSGSSLPDFAIPLEIGLMLTLFSSSKNEWGYFLHDINSRQKPQKYPVFNTLEKAADAGFEKSQEILLDLIVFLMQERSQGEIPSQSLKGI